VPPGSLLAATLRLLIGAGVPGVGADEGSLLLLDEAGGELRFAMTVGNDESEALLLNQRVPLGAGITGLAASRREIQIGAPLYDEIDQPRRVEGVMAAPLLAGDELLGVITAITFHQDRRFDAASIQLFGALAVIGGVLMDQARQLAKVAGGAHSSSGVSP
jgi:GAF domain-containing protein